MLIFGVSAFLFIMLLPALLELKKPKDAGPRRILEDSTLNQLGIKLVSIERTEEKMELDLTIAKRIAEVMAVLPNIEA
jgi:hypothetical protein